MSRYFDVSDHDEDVRIQKIGMCAMERLNQMAFITDDIPGKPERYIRKLLAKFPQIEIINQFKGPTPGAYTVIVKRKLP